MKSFKTFLFSYFFSWSREQLEKSIAQTRKLMQEAAKKLEFIQAAQYRDEVLRLEELLKEK